MLPAAQFFTNKPMAKYFFLQRNMSLEYDGLFNMKTGVNNLVDLGKIKKFKIFSEPSIWLLYSILFTVTHDIGVGLENEVICCADDELILLISSHNKRNIITASLHKLET